VLNTYEEAGFTVFEDPTRAVVALAAMGRFGHAFAARNYAPAGSAAGRAAHANAERSRSQGHARRRRHPGRAERACAVAEAAVIAARELGFPVVMKILSPDILHKSEIGGVLLDVRDEAAVRGGFATLMQRARDAAPDARIDGVLVARQVSGGVECIMGIKQDPPLAPSRCSASVACSLKCSATWSSTAARSVRTWPNA
jgi:acyl-CoA synthetase (NDP forming)